MPTAKNEFRKLLDATAKFVEGHRGTWGHAEWEAFVAQVEQIGYPGGEELARNVGSLLEAAKHFYFAMPPAPAKAKPAVRRKPAARKAGAK